MAVVVQLFAAAREAVGAAGLEVPAGPVRAVCEAVVAAAPEPSRPRVRQVLAASTLLCDGIRYRADELAVLRDGAVVDVLPPFAGG